MADFQSHTTISLSKVIDAAQSGYALRPMPARAPNESAVQQSLTLNVVAVKNRQVLLQEPLSGTKLLIDKNAISLPSNTALARGDSLVLLSANQTVATFLLQKESQKQLPKLSGNALQNVTLSLNAQWPDLPASVLKKTSPLIINQIQLASNTSQANNLANAIVAIATHNKQPALPVHVTATALFINAPSLKSTSLGTTGIDKNLASMLQLQFKDAFGKGVSLNLPLLEKASNLLSAKVINELKSMLDSGQQVSVRFNANSPRHLVGAITAGQSAQTALSTQALSEINKMLASQKNGQLQQHISSLVMAPHSPNLHKGIVLNPTVQTLQSLGPSIKQSLTAGLNLLTPSAMQSAGILISQTQQNAQQINISLLAKPITVNINQDMLSAISKAGVGFNAITSAGLNDGAGRSYSAGRPANNNDVAAITGLAPTSSKNEKIGQFIPSQQLKAQLISYLEAHSKHTGKSAVALQSLQSSIYSELNQVLPRAQSATQTLPNLLAQLQKIGREGGAQLQQLIYQVSQQISNNISASDPMRAAMPDSFATELDEAMMSPQASQIKEQFAAPALLNLAGLPVQGINGAGNQSGLVNGLVAMLKASLQAKLLLQQPQLLNALAQSPQLAQVAQFAQISGLLQGKNKPTNHSAKLLQDLGRLDPKGNLIGELNKILSGHSLHKLSGAESSLQQQDSFYYTLPNMFSSQQNDIEVVIKREHSQPREKQSPGQQAWQLSMKLDVGKSGEVLAKVKLSQQKLDLNLYASNQGLKEKILHYLPHLNARLSALGLQVNQQCYLGKIPKTLHTTDYQVVQTYV